ncbi:TRAP transporter small permease [Marasmitruncus massiliensis]|uniref:TRAP transporter small permease n=1 Tax=Marasmitruncus massiliensis TaxID=1944642 RepID=UPI000C7A2A2F|nr:TRAP transporter small permease [Marasmitruncus massiliensis]
MNKIATVMSKLTKWLEQFVKVVSIILLVILVCTVFFQVARRTLTGKSFVEIEEFSIVLASWCAFMTVAYAVRRKVHVRIEVFTEKLPFYPSHILMLFIEATIFVAAVFLVRYGWQLAQNKMMVPMTVLPIKSGYWYISYPVGMAFACIFLLDNVIQEMAIMINGSKNIEQS